MSWFVLSPIIALYSFDIPSTTQSNHSVYTTLLTVSNLRRELLRLISDRATINRLMKGTCSNHPGRSASWIAEKVIYDLKRGR